MRMLVRIKDSNTSNYMEFVIEADSIAQAIHRIKSDRWVYRVWPTYFKDAGKLDSAEFKTINFIVKETY